MVRSLRVCLDHLIGRLSSLVLGALRSKGDFAHQGRGEESMPQEYAKSKRRADGIRGDILKKTQKTKGKKRGNGFFCERFGGRENRCIQLGETAVKVHGAEDGAGYAMEGPRKFKLYRG